MPKLDNIINLLKEQQFREYSRGWYKGFIVISFPGSLYGKTIKRVNPRINTRFYDLRSAYPYKLTEGFYSTDNINPRVGDCDRLYYKP